MQMTGGARTDASPVALHEPAPASFQYALTGPVTTFDPRVTAVRGDLADIALAGRFFAPHYVAPQLRRCAPAITMLRAASAHDAQAVSQLITGEGFALLDSAGDWGWGYCLIDGYCGYVLLNDLVETAALPTHIVHARAALVFADASIKAPTLDLLPMGAQITVAGESACGKFWQTGTGFVSKRHARSLAEPGTDPAIFAMQLTGAPYLWGGRSGDGLDCSGLVQLVMALTGHNAPRDSDQQLEALGEFLADDAPVQRGDLVFFPGHVGIMADDTHLIHANAHWMQVVTEPLADVIARFPESTPQPVLARKRIG